MLFKQFKKPFDLLFSYALETVLKIVDLKLTGALETAPNPSDLCCGCPTVNQSLQILKRYKVMFHHRFYSHILRGPV